MTKTIKSNADILKSREYTPGFVTDIETELIPKGLDENVVRFISEKRGEPEFMLNFRLKAYKKWLTMKEPEWPNVHYPKIDYQDIVYHAEPKVKKKLASMDEVDPELIRTFEKLGVPLDTKCKLILVSKKG